MPSPKRRAKRYLPDRPDPDADQLTAFARSADVHRERVRRLTGCEPSRMSDAEFADGMAWRDRFHDEWLATWRAAHGLDPLPRARVQ